MAYSPNSLAWLEFLVSVISFYIKNIFNFDNIFYTLFKNDFGSSAIVRINDFNFNLYRP
jgi:hypothetical protein